MKLVGIPKGRDALELARFDPYHESWEIQGEFIVFTSQPLLDTSMVAKQAIRIPSHVMQIVEQPEERDLKKPPRDGRPLETAPVGGSTPLDHPV